MNRQTKPDPYSAFKDDRERRLALVSRARWGALQALAVAIVLASGWIEGKVQWLISLFP